VSGWLKPIFLRFPVGAADEPPLLALVLLALVLLVLVVPQAARTGPATARVAPATPTRLTNCRRDNSRSVVSSWPLGLGALDTCGFI